MALNRGPATLSRRGVAVLVTTLWLGGWSAGTPTQAQTSSPFQGPVCPGCAIPPTAPENDPWPVAETDSLGSTVGPVTFQGGMLLANDRGTTALSLVGVASISSGGGSITGTGPYTYTPAPLFIGNDVFTYEIRDAAGETTVGIVKVTVTPDVVAPTVSLTAPAAGPVSGNVVITASAADNVGVAGVKFFDGLTQIGPEVTAAPFQTTWNTTLVADGNHSLSAIARDAAGHTSTSAVVGVTVSNAPPPPPPAGGLVLSFSFDEADGQPAMDASTSGRNGVITGAVRVPGKVGRALQFDGVDDWVTVIDGAAGTPLDLTTGMTIEAWVNPTAMSGWETVALKERGLNALSYALYANDGAPLAGGVAAPAGYVRIGTVDRAVQGVGALATTGWTHLATTYDGTMQRLYVNGVEVGTRAQTGSMAVGNQPLRIGGNASFAGEFFEGLIDEVKVYNRALSADEIGADMGTVAPPPPPPAPAGGLVLSLSFDEADGQPAMDASTSGRNGVITGAVRVPGKVGRALQFDGVDDWVTVIDGAAGTPLDLTTGMTIEAWVNPTAMSGWETVALKERGLNALSYALYANDGAPLAEGVAAPAGYVRAGGLDQGIRGPGALAPGTWTHLATTYDGVTQRLYVNGVQVASRAQAGLMAVDNAPFRIGGNASFTGEFFEGLIDEVKVYNRALTAAEIKADVNGPLP